MSWGGSVLPSGVTDGALHLLSQAGLLSVLARVSGRGRKGAGRQSSEALPVDPEGLLACYAPVGITSAGRWRGRLG